MRNGKKSLKKGGLSKFYLFLGISGLAVALLLSGCATPTIQRPTHTKILQPDQDDNVGGSFMESGDIRTVASKMTGSLLSTYEIAQHEGNRVRIAIAPIKNNTRFIIDKDIFMKRLRMEMNKYANGRIRFFSQGMGQNVRREIFNERDEDAWDATVDELATYIATSYVVSNATEPLRVAVIPVKNTNIAGLNADSFTALVRSKVSEKSRGKIAFLAREENGKVIDQILAESDLRNLGLVQSSSNNMITGVDYFLGGEFIAKSLAAESGSSAGKPNVTTYLNVMLIDAQTGVIPVEKLATASRKMKSGLGKSDFILTGELSALSKASASGNRSDYVIMSFQLVDPESNEVVWEDFYETKKVSRMGVIYK